MAVAVGFSSPELSKTVTSIQSAESNLYENEPSVSWKIQNTVVQLPLENAQCSFFERENGEPETEATLNDLDCKIESNGNSVIIHWSDGVKTQIEFSVSGNVATVDGQKGLVHGSDYVCVNWNPSKRRGFEKTICYSIL